MNSSSSLGSSKSTAQLSSIETVVLRCFAGDGLSVKGASRTCQFAWSQHARNTGKIDSESRCRTPTFSRTILYAWRWTWYADAGACSGTLTSDRNRSNDVEENAWRLETLQYSPFLEDQLIQSLLSADLIYPTIRRLRTHHNHTDLPFLLFIDVHRSHH